MLRPLRLLIKQIGLSSQLQVPATKLKWAQDRTDSVLLDFKKLIPPSEARTFHSLMIESLIKEQAGLGDMLSYYSAVLSYGFGDDKTLDRGNQQFLEAQKLYQQAQYEFQDLLNKVKK